MHIAFFPSSLSFFFFLLFFAFFLYLIVDVYLILMLNQKTARSASWLLFGKRCPGNARRGFAAFKGRPVGRCSAGRPRVGNALGSGEQSRCPWPGGAGASRTFGSMCSFCDLKHLFHGIILGFTSWRGIEPLTCIFEAFQRLSI